MDVHANNDYSAYLLPKIGAIVTGVKSVPPASAAEIKDDDSGDMALWGDNNDFPQRVIEDVRKDPEIGTLLDKQARLLYSGGLVWGKITQKDNGQEVLTALEGNKNTVIKDWIRRSNISRYLYEAAKDLYWFNNAFPEVILNVGRTEIVQLCAQPAEQCRWSKQNSKGFSNICYINANFPDDKETSERTVKLPVIDPYYDPAETLRTLKGTNYIYPLSIPTPGSKYYQLADWNSIRQSGWLEVSQAIPKFKKSLLEKQLTIKYHIEIADRFWDLKYPDWGKLDETSRQEIKRQELANFQEMMAGLEKTGSSLFTPFKVDFNLGKEFSLWKITAIDDKIKQGSFLEEGKDASLYKQAAIGLHPALVGTMPNSGLGGAGSNIREAFNLHILSCRAHQDIILEPLNNLVKYYNNWDPEVEFRFRNSFMNTLDKGSETSNTNA